MRQFSFMVLGAALLALSVPAQAQQAAKVFRIGFMAGVSPPPAEPSRSNIEAFRHGLREFGYIEGKNVIIESRCDQNHPIVMGFGKDPVRDGLITSLAKPGGNITGVVVAPEDVLAGKRLVLIKEAVPQAATIALLGRGEPSSRLQVEEAQKVAPTPIGIDFCRSQTDEDSLKAVV